MASNPFSSDYAGAPATRAVITQPVAVNSAEATAAAKQPVGIDIASGFMMTPIPMVTGKPKRVIVKGKVTRD
jgi:hypothetical protein